MTSYQFETVDLFTDRRFGGNPLAVFTDARGLSESQMQALSVEGARTRPAPPHLPSVLCQSHAAWVETPVLSVLAPWSGAYGDCSEFARPATTSMSSTARHGRALPASRCTRACGSSGRRAIGETGSKDGHGHISTSWRRRSE